jgi:hypothetical protein
MSDWADEKAADLIIELSLVPPQRTIQRLAQHLRVVEAQGAVRGASKIKEDIDNFFENRAKGNA